MQARQENADADKGLQRWADMGFTQREAHMRQKRLAKQREQSLAGIARADQL